MLGDKLYSILEPNNTDVKVRRLARDVKAVKNRSRTAAGSTNPEIPNTPVPAPGDFTVTITSEQAQDGLARPLITVAPASATRFSDVRGLLGYDVRLTKPTGETVEVKYQLEDSLVLGSVNLRVPPITYSASSGYFETYSVETRLVSSVYGVGEWSEPQSVDVYATSYDDVTPPATPASLAVAAITGGYKLTWNKPAEPDYRYSEVYLSVDNIINIASDKRDGFTTGNTYTVLWSQKDYSIYQYVGVCHVDTAGNRSAFSVWPIPSPDSSGVLIAGDQIASSVSLNGKSVSLGTGTIAGTSVTLTSAGLNVNADRTSPGSNNVNFYTEDGDLAGILYGGGASGSGDALIGLEATFPGAGTTTLKLSSLDEMTMIVNPTQIHLNGSAISLGGGPVVLDQGLQLPVVTYTTSNSLGGANYMVRANPSADATMTLPAASGCTGQLFVIKNVSSYKVTVARAGTDLIDGLTSYPLVQKNQSVTLQSNGSGWDVIEQSGLVLESDGSRWLGPEIYLPFTVQTTLQPTGTTVALYVCTVPSDYPLYVVRADLATYVTSDQNGSNYFTINIKKKDSTGTDTVMATTSTISGGNQAASTRVKRPLTSFSANPSATSDLMMFIECVKNGTPGNLYLEQAVLARRVYS